MPYIIKDEDGEVMRLVRRHKEAVQIIEIRDGWTMTYIPKPKPQLPTEEAPF